MRNLLKLENWRHFRYLGGSVGSDQDIVDPTRYSCRVTKLVPSIQVITPFAAPPWWIPRTINVQANIHKELLVETEALIMGAAAIAPHRTIRSYLGPSKAFTVYSTELYGITLAMIQPSYTVPREDASNHL